MLTQKILPLFQLILLVFVTVIANQIKASADKLFSHIKLLESFAYVIHIQLLPKRKRLYIDSTLVTLPYFKEMGNILSQLQGVYINSVMHIHKYTVC